MKKMIATLAAAAAVALPALSVPSQADDSKLTKGYHTMDAMGCMLLRECTDGVKQINNLLDLSSEYPNTDEFTFVANEFNRMLLALDRVGVKVFLAPTKYFPKSHRGAIIKPEDEVPMIWRVMAERTYPEHAVPWEAEAGWAGRTEKMTMEALESCARGTMWTDYEPTPLTREWLVENGHLPK